MRVLLTGATGQVGGAILTQLGPVADIVAPGRDKLDLARPREIAAVLDRMAPDLIINPAAYTAVDRAEDESEMAYRVNAEAPSAMARWAAANRVPLVHFSTDYVFDGVAAKPWREGAPTNPLSAYGASKLAGEVAIRAASGPHLIIRTSWVYAARGVNFLRTIARLGRERKELRIVADQFGAPTSARLIADVVASIVRQDLATLGERFAASKGLVNVAASGETTWHNFAVAIAQGLRARGVTLAVENIVPIATAEYPTKATRPANSRLDLTRLKGIFQITPPDWATALAPELDELSSELSPGAGSENSGQNRTYRMP